MRIMTMQTALLLCFASALSTQSPAAPSIGTVDGVAATVGVQGLERSEQSRRVGAVTIDIAEGSLVVDAQGVRIEHYDGRISAFADQPGRQFATATVLADGRVLVWGGINGLGEVERTGLWLDPATSRTERADIALSPRAGHTATVLTDGRLLIVGGRLSDGALSKRAELWDLRYPDRVVAVEAGFTNYGGAAELDIGGRISIYRRANVAGPLESISVYDPRLEAFIPNSGTFNEDTFQGTFVAETNPPDQAAGFPIDGWITWHLAEPIDASTFAQESVTLLGPGGPFPVDVALAGSGSLIFARPRMHLLPGARYTAFLTNATSVSGRSAEMLTITFTTRASVDGEGDETPASPSSGTGLSENVGAQAPREDRVATPDTTRSGVTVRLSTGAGLAAGLAEDKCDSHDSVHGFMFCHEIGSVTNGVFTPGFRNTGGRWRLNKATPPVPEMPDSPKGMSAVVETTLAGVVRRIDDEPLAGVSVSLDGQVQLTDHQGRFVLTNVTPGRRVLFVDGSTANHGDYEFGEFQAAVDIKPGQRNVVPFNLYVPRITAQDKVAVPSPTTTALVITHPTVPGLEIHVPPGTVFRDRNGKVIRDIAIVPLPVDRSPIPVPENFPVYVSMQPGGATVESVSPSVARGLRIIYPNYADESISGQGFWYYDAEADGWKVYAKARGSGNRKTIEPDSEFGELTFMPKGGASIGGPPGTKVHGCGVHRGDPVECGSGAFQYNSTELTVNDIEAVAFVRTYNSMDTAKRAFGRGGSHAYGLYLYDPTTSCNNATQSTKLTLVDGEGAEYPFELVPGSGSGAESPGGYLRHTSTPTRFYGATMRVQWGGGHTGPLFAVTLPDQTEYRFNAGCKSTLASIADRFGNMTRLSYTAGLLTEISLPSGRGFNLSYNANNVVSQVSDSSGRTVSYLYDSNDRLLSATYPDSTIEQYTYDSSGNMLSIQDRRNNPKVLNEYDGNQRVHTQTYPDGGTYEFIYTVVAGNVVTTDITDARGHVERIEFNEAGYKVSVTKAVGTTFAQTTAYVRGQDELITSETDALGRVTTTVYDDVGGVLSRTYLYGTPGEATYSFTYTPDYHQVATIVDPLGHTTTYEYEGGCLTSVQDALGHATTFTCNSAGQPLVAQDALGHMTHFSYVGYDLRTIEDPLGRTTTIDVDGLGRLTAIRDALGRTSRLAYDVNGRVAQSTDALGQVTSFAYDGNGNLLSVTDPRSAVNHFSYDVRDRQTSRTDALNQAESWTYDDMGNVLTFTDRKHQQVVYQYDALDRPSTIAYSDGSSISATFDAGNRLVELVDTISGTITRDYDGMDRIVEENTPQGVVTYTYDTAGRRSSMTPANQAPILYAYDVADRLSEIVQGNEVVSFDHDIAGRRSKLVLPNGVVTQYTYNSADEVTDISYKNSVGASLGGISYTYDLAGQRIGQTGGFAADVLPAATVGANTFDLNNRQTALNGVSLSYDANGDLVTINESPILTEYVFDVRHRLAAINVGGTTIASFEYDPLNRRVAKTVDGVTTSYLYDGWNPIQETQGSIENAILTGLETDERFSRSEAAGPRYFATDALGSTLALTDSSGLVQQIYAYEPYGQLSATGASDNPYQYTGRENDRTGLYYYRARYYSPSLKRFISEDPLGLDAGLNGYAYVFGNPLTLTDPFGLSPDYGDRYLCWVIEHDINVGPYAVALANGLWLKRWAPAGDFRGPLLGSKNPFTSVHRAFGVPGGGSVGTQTIAQGIGLLTVFIGIYNVTVYVEGLIYAIPEDACGCR